MPTSASAWRRSASLLTRCAWYSRFTEYGIILSTSLAFSFLRGRAALVAVTAVCGLSPQRRTRTLLLDTPPGARSARFGRAAVAAVSGPREHPTTASLRPSRSGRADGRLPARLPRPDLRTPPRRTRPFPPSPPRTTH